MALLCISSMGNSSFHLQMLFHFRDFHFRTRSLTQWCWHKKCCTLLYIYPNLMVTFISTCLVLSNLHVPFPVLPHIGNKRSFCHGVTLILPNKLERGFIQHTTKLMKTCYKVYQHQEIFIDKQSISEINPLFSLTYNIQFQYSCI